MRLPPLLSLVWRESRTARRRLLLYMSSISLGVGALIAIDSFASNTQRSVREQARAILGGDMSLSSRSPYPAPVLRALDSLRREGVGVAEKTTFASMALLPRTGLTRLAQVQAVTPDFPFYGDIVTAPAAAWRQLHAGHHAVVDPSLLVALDGRVGDTLSLGLTRFVISGIVRSVPGDVGIGTAIGPRVFIPARLLDETALLQFGSRSERQSVLKLTPRLTPARFIYRFRDRLERAQVRFRTAAEAEFTLTQAVEQLRDFLSVIGLVALLLGGIGVASGVNAFVLRKIDTVAVLRCLGATSGQVLGVYVLQALAMGVVGAAAGAVLGVALQWGLPRVLGDFLPMDVHVALEPTALATGLLVGVWVALLFALRPLVALRHVSPLQTLRRESDAEALRQGRVDPLRIAVALLVGLSVAALGIARAATVRQGLAFSLAIAAAVLVLVGSAAAVSAGARHLVRPGWPFTLRQGVAALYRPANQTRAVVLALGFGVFLVSTIYQVQTNLLRTVDASLGRSRANVVFFDVQEDQAEPLESLIRARGYPVMQRTPLVPMRITGINGISGPRLLTGDTAQRGGGARPPWVLRREYRSTYRDTLAPSERVVAGRFHTGGSAAPSLPRVSLDVGVARDLRVEVGDTLTWDVQGRPLRSVITSLREVDWTRFEPNFYAVFESRALAGAPQQFVLLADVPGSANVARLQREAVLRFPNVASLDLTLVQQTVSRILGKVATALRFMAALALALALPVLFSAVSATRRERLREAVLLKVLGGTREQVRRILLTEYFLLGTIGSLTGVLLSTGAGWALLHFVFHQPFVPAPVPAVLVTLAMALMAVTIGWVTGRDVFRETPMAALREA